MSTDRRTQSSGKILQTETQLLIAGYLASNSVGYRPTGGLQLHVTHTVTSEDLQALERPRVTGLTDPTLSNHEERKYFAVVYCFLMENTFVFAIKMCLSMLLLQCYFWRFALNAAWLFLVLEQEAALL